MSIQFNDTTNLKGLVQLYEREIGAGQGDISGNTTRLKQFTADCNIALDDFTDIAIKASGSYQNDDVNHTDHPIIYTNIVSGKQDYTFTVDENDNRILDLYRVFVLRSADSTSYEEIYPIDQQSEYTKLATEDPLNVGSPCKYDKTGQTLFLDPKPNYSVANGIKMMIAREMSYFTHNDTSKVAGIPGLFHAYLYLKPALNHARRNNLDNERKTKEAVMEMEDKITKHFAWRARDERKQLTMKPINFR